MIGTPPFTRPTAECRIKSASCAGLGRILRRASKTPMLAVPPQAIVMTATTVWLIIRANKSLRLGLRLFDEPNGFSKATARSRRRNELEVSASGGMGKYSALIRWVENESLCLRVTISLRPSGCVELGKLPRQACLMDARLDPLESGLVYTTQTGPTAGLAFVSAQETYIFYFQNLTALSAYSNLTGVSLEGAVGVAWPELGLSMPAGDEPLSSGQTVILSDAFLRIRNGVSLSESECACRFCDDLHATYLQLKLPPAEWFDWEALAAQTVRDLSRSKKCLRTLAGRTYLNPYVGCTTKPPESMVQAAVSVPLMEYQTWLGKAVPLIKRLDKTLLSFHCPKIGTIARWLPGAAFHKEEPGEEEVVGRVDSWYLFHTLLNFARLAEMGRNGEMDAFLASLPYAIHTAHHFDYDWPVFFDEKNLNVFKQETAHGAGGEQDTPGLYAHVMMQAWSFTRNPLYLAEAEAAAQKLQGLGFGVLYQTNNTMFTSVALARLWKETGNALYKELSFVCIGSLLSHLWMWEAETPDRPWQTFMGLPPLHDAPYIAAYEEGEIYACTSAYLEALGSDAPESIVSLLVEYGKRLLHRGRFYYPSEMPADSVCAEPKEGTIATDLAIPVEDLYPSTEKCGQVGQEVYGAALALILTTRSYHQWKGIPFRLWCDALLFDVEFDSRSDIEGSLRFRIAGAGECDYEVRILPPSGNGHSLILKMKCGSASGKLRSNAPVKNPDGHRRYRTHGGERVEIHWQT